MWGCAEQQWLQCYSGNKPSEHPPHAFTKRRKDTHATTTKHLYSLGFGQIWKGKLAQSDCSKCEAVKARMSRHVPPPLCHHPVCLKSVFVYVHPLKRGEKQNIALCQLVFWGGGRRGTIQNNKLLHGVAPYIRHFLPHHTFLFSGCWFVSNVRAEKQPSLWGGPFLNLIRWRNGGGPLHIWSICSEQQQWQLCCMSISGSNMETKGA